MKSAAHWYVLEFSAVRYKTVFRYLDSLNAEWYCPMQLTLRKRNGRLKSYTRRESPLFPGYLFIRLDFDILHSTLVTRLSHVHRFVSFGNEPVSVSEDIILQVKACEINEDAFHGGIHAISHEFAEILLLDDPLKRNYALLNYLASSNLQHAS
jgi:transcriptional antiterminator RfaH